MGIFEFLLKALFNAMLNDYVCFNLFFQEFFWMYDSFVFTFHCDINPYVLCLLYSILVAKCNIFNAYILF